jgi:opine dehydrogenase
MKDLKFAVLGAGHGGKALAAHLAIKGFSVNLYNRTFSRIKPIKLMRGIELEGEVKGFGRLDIVTDDMESAIEGADIIMVVVPANGHRPTAAKCAPFLKNGQIVVLNPGRTCGALEFLQVLRESGNNNDVIISEAQTFIYASRGMGPATAKIFRIKQAIPVAAIPSGKTEEVVDKLNTAFPEFISGTDVIETSLNNMGAVFHPSITILNASRIESTLGNFQFYIEGVTQSVAKILEAVDRERVRIAGALECGNIYSAIDWLSMAYNVVEDNLFDAIHSNPGYVGIMAPRTTNVRYITEDVPMSLVPISEVGKKTEVETPVIDSLIHIADSIFDKDFREMGRNLNSLGMTDLNIDQIRRLLIEGKK